MGGKGRIVGGFLAKFHDEFNSRRHVDILRLLRLGDYDGWLNKALSVSSQLQFLASLNLRLPPAFSWVTLCLTPLIMELWVKIELDLRIMKEWISCSYLPVIKQHFMIFVLLFISPNDPICW